MDHVYWHLSPYHARFDLDPAFQSAIHVPQFVVSCDCAFDQKPLCQLKISLQRNAQDTVGHTTDLGLATS